MNVDICNDSEKVHPICRVSDEQQPVGIVHCSYKIFSFTTQSTRDFANFRPGRLLDENNVKLGLDLEYDIDDK